ncbi:MerR family transcriptional regulator [Undibacter mobilis]|uniref:MerR family transcriptional regulator n=1 Tax=Undibacter mobilis TaxID=2292256 RepID=A0A371B176_9BRAD|nr:MerR family transcriptional regulator [Undibacter mobilis]RDV01339.1 MerR family transcriptional regulator [Undibacter mobilis]
MDDKAPGAFRTISEVADELDLPQHVLRFWESRFNDIKPMKRGGGRRYYRPDDIDLLRGIRHLLYGEGYTIRGVQRILREQGVDFVQSIWQEGAPAVAVESEDAEDLAEETLAADEEEYEDEVEDDAEEAGASDEPRGLRGRIGSLIGRDLNERDTRADRTEPLLHEAPMPRVEPGDRLGGAVRGAPETFAPAPRPAAKPAAAAPAGLTAEQSDRLRHVLDELKECRQLIETAATAANRS